MSLRTVLMALLGGSMLAMSFVLPWAWWMNVPAVGAFALAQAGPLKSRVAASLAFGWAAFVGGYHWLQPTLVSLWGGLSVLSWAVWFALAAWFSLRFVLVGLGYGALRRRGANAQMALTVPWILAEWAYPTLFPFFLASPWIGRPLWVSIVSLGGPLLASALLCALGATLSDVIESRKNRGRVRLRPLMGVSLAVLAALVAGTWSNARVSRAIEESPTLEVAIVQANIDVSKPTERLLAHRRYLDESMAIERAGDVDLLVWPETSYAVPIDDRFPTSGAAVSGTLRTPLLFGGVIEERSTGERWNSALLADGEGQIRSIYRKRHRIPFAEFVPWGAQFPRWMELMPTRSQFSRGRGPASIQFGEYSIATPICYEAIRPSFVRSLAREAQPELLVTLANDGWFDDSVGPSIHLMLARMRAVEHRRFMVRATNTGISAIIDPFGQIVAQTALLENATLVGEVRLLNESTLYALFGDWPAGLAILWLIVWLLHGRTTKRRLVSTNQRP
ncbi:MAG: apolipoprotein N-acyltransferase [Myxococcota bacterium]